MQVLHSGRACVFFVKKIIAAFYERTHGYFIHAVQHDTVGNI